MCPARVEEVSLPPPGTVGIPIIEVSARARSLIEDFENTMLHEDGLERMKESQVVPYMDPHLRDKRQLLLLAVRSYRAGMLTTTTEAKGFVSMFTVVKKWEGEKLNSRLIFDERLENLRWRTLPW